MKKITKHLFALEEFLHNFIDKHLFTIGMLLVLLISLLVRWHLAPITCLSADYNVSLLPWVEHYKENGIINGLSQARGSYYIPYNVFLALIAYLPGEPWIYISAFSILCDYVSAIFIYFIAKEILEEACLKAESIKYRAALAAVISLLLPAVILNGSLWKQCDSVYTCFLIISLYYVLKRRYNLSLVMLGISFIFKMQAIYIFPLFIILYIFREKGLSLLHFLWIPGMYLLGGLPAVLTGRRISNVYGIYYRQANGSGFDSTTIGMPNIYDFGLTDYPALSLPGILLTMAIFIIMACVLNRYRKGLNKANILYIGIWCLWACIMFLPAQHERYNYPVIILLTIFCLLTNIKKIWTAVIINLISCYQYGSYLFKAEIISYQTMAIFHMAAFIYVTYDVIKMVQNQHMD